MEKTFGQIEETQNDVPQTQSNQDETSEAVANLTSILERPKSPDAQVLDSWIPEFSISNVLHNKEEKKIINFRIMHSKVDRIAQQQKTINGNNQVNPEDELKKSAGEILNGVKRTVEVQVVNSSNTFNFQDQTILGIAFTIYTIFAHITIVICLQTKKSICFHLISTSRFS